MKRRDKPCERCGWKYEGFHVCTDLSTPCTAEQHVKALTPQQVKTAERVRLRREAEADREAELVEKYDEGYSYQNIADLFDMPVHTVTRVLRKAQAAGRVEIRPRGSSVRRVLTEEELTNGTIQQRV